VRVVSFCTFVFLGDNDASRSLFSRLFSPPNPRRKRTVETEEAKERKKKKRNLLTITGSTTTSGL